MADEININESELKDEAKYLADMIDAGKKFAHRILANLADTKDQEISVELKVNGKELGQAGIDDIVENLISFIYLGAVCAKELKEFKSETQQEIAS